jgi:hypothetical protein
VPPDSWGIQGIFTFGDNLRDPARLGTLVLPLTITA